MSLLIGVCLSGGQHNKYYVVLTQESYIILSQNTTFFNYQKWQQTCCLCTRNAICIYISHGICERNSYFILTHSLKADPLQHNIYYVVLIFLPTYPPHLPHIRSHLLFFPSMQNRHTHLHACFILSSASTTAHVPDVTALLAGRFVQSEVICTIICIWFKCSLCSRPVDLI